MQVFETMLCPATATHPRYGEGSVMALRSGDLLLAYGEFYTEERGDGGAAHVLGRISKDCGRTWGEPFKLVENDCITVFSASLVRLPSGEILLFYERKETAETIQEAGQNCRPWVRRSSDEGQSWSEPTCLMPDDHKAYAVLNNDRVVIHSTGRLLAPIAPMEPREPDDPYHSTSTCLLSDDQGRTWRRSQTTLRLDAFDGLQEPAVVEKKDGSLMMLMRTSRGHQYRSLSSDRGDTWSEVKPVPELISPVSPVSVKRIPSTGHLLAIFNKTYDPLGRPGPSGYGFRTPLTATISLDDGNSWTLLKNIENDPTKGFDYVSMTFLPGDEVLLTYHQTEFSTSVIDWRRNLKLKILPVAWFYESAGDPASVMPQFLLADRK